MRYVHACPFGDSALLCSEAQADVPGIGSGSFNQDTRCFLLVPVVSRIDHGTVARGRCTLSKVSAFRIFDGPGTHFPLFSQPCCNQPFHSDLKNCLWLHVPSFALLSIENFRAVNPHARIAGRELPGIIRHP